MKRANNNARRKLTSKSYTNIVKALNIYNLYMQQTNYLYNFYLNKININLTFMVL